MEQPPRTAGIQQTFASNAEVEVYRRLRKLVNDPPIAENELLANLGLFMTRPTLQRLLFASELYEMILPVHGVVMEFGCRWGQNLALFLNLRTIHEPWNPTRKIIGFDTFEGFVEVTAEDGDDEVVAAGNYAVTDSYEDYLRDVLDCHRQLAPRPHLQTFELRRGDAVLEVPRYLEEHSETVVAMAYFDMDLYAPTRKVLEAIGPRLTQGSILAFDQVGHPSWPGETLALMEELGLRNVRLRRTQASVSVSYIEVM